MQAPTIFDALHLAVSPTILISCCGLLLLTMANRLARTIDLTRSLVRSSSSNKEIQIAIFVKRAKWIRSAILFTSICILLTVILVLVLFLSVFTKFNLGFAIAILFTLSLISLAVSLIYFMVDIFSSLKALETYINSD